MLTALFITDCSVDSALSLRAWLSQQSRHPICLTVVHPYDIPAGESLHKSVCQPAKADALARLANWTAILGNLENTHLTTETLFSNPEVALTIHLMIRNYNYLLVDNWVPIMDNTLTVRLEKTQTSIHSVCPAIAPSLQLTV